MPKMLWLVLALQLAGFVTAQTSTSAQHAGEESRNHFWWEDFDGDGREDAFVLAPNGRASLLRNQGGGTLQNVTRQAGLEGLALVRFARWEDFDGDGRPDLFLGTGAGPSLLFENHGGTFVEVGAAAGLAHTGRDLHAEWIDYDRNGLVDLHVRTRAEILLYRNLGDGLFEPVDLGIAATSAAGAAPLPPPVETSRSSPEPAPEDSGSTSPGEAPEHTAARGTIGVDRSEGPVVAEEGGVLESAPVPSKANAVIPPCGRYIGDMAAGGCLQASSVPTLGELYPITQDLFVSPQTGFVGIGTTSPSERLDVNGTISTNDEFVARDPTGQYALKADGSRVVTFLDDLGYVTSSIGTASNNGGSLALYGFANTLAFQVDGQTPPGGASLRMYDTLSETQTVELNSQFGNTDAGALLLADSSGEFRTLLYGNIAGGGYGILRSSAGVDTVKLEGQGPAGGGRIRLCDDSGTETIDLVGAGSEIILYDGGSDSITMRALDASGTAGEIRMKGPSGNVTVDIDGEDEGGGGLRFFEGDGSLSCDFFGSVYDFRDSSGLPTISFDRVSGTKSAVVDTPNHGQRLFYTMESPEVWFEDFGSARLSGGSATIHLDPVFLEAVTVNEEHPLKVFVTLNGESEGVFVEKGTTSFTVREHNGGRSDVAFDYRVAAKRAGLEDRRLEPYPEASAGEQPAIRNPEPEPLRRVRAEGGDPSGPPAGGGTVH